MEQTIHTAINWLDYDRIKSILEQYGFAVYGEDSENALREALRENIMDGTIPQEEVI